MIGSEEGGKTFKLMKAHPCIEENEQPHKNRGSEDKSRWDKEGKLEFGEMD